MKNTNVLIDSCIENAKALFKELEGEFYPFGYVTDNFHRQSPYYVTVDDEFPNVNDVFKQIVKSLISDIGKGKFREGVVCSLSTKKVDGMVFEFLDIKYLNDSGGLKDYDILIDPNYQNYTFNVLKVFEYPGTILVYNS